MLFHDHHSSSPRIVLLSPEEQALRIARIRSQSPEGAALIVLHDNADIYYATGRVFAGYVVIPVDDTLSPIYFVKRPNHFEGSDVEYIRKPEDMSALLAARGLAPCAHAALELGSIPYSDIVRIQKALGASTLSDATSAMRRARAVKTTAELEKLRASGVKQTRVYESVPRLFSPGMTDIELQIEIERALRLEGCLGQFRTAGGSMELFMGNVLTGDNSDSPSPYDFAMGGAGLDPSLPVGADGTLIKPGKPVMVDMNGNFTGYMTDMTRCYSYGAPEPRAEAANLCSRNICSAIAEAARPGVEAKALYEIAEKMAREAGLHDYFMGWHSHAGFVGHGIGIEVNELPVLAPRSRDILEAGNVIAVEPKFVLPGIGAVGIENTYIVRASDPAERITTAPEEIIGLV